jgi:hypothetical protein
VENIEQQVLAMSEPDSSVDSRRAATLSIMKGLLGLLNEGLFRDLSDSSVENLSQTDILCITDLSVHFSTMSSGLIRRGKV